VVRRELSDNYCFYEANYDNLAACYDWARDSLNKHRADKREFIYTKCGHPPPLASHCMRASP
jgi:deoxyribodipyrimidine photo-lyase